MLCRRRRKAEGCLEKLKKGQHEMYGSTKRMQGRAAAKMRKRRKQIFFLRLLRLFAATILPVLVF